MCGSSLALRRSKLQSIDEGSGDRDQLSEIAPALRLHAPAGSLSMLLVYGYSEQHNGF